MIFSGQNDTGHYFSKVDLKTLRRFRNNISNPDNFIGEQPQMAAQPPLAVTKLIATSIQFSLLIIIIYFLFSLITYLLYIIIFILNFCFVFILFLIYFVFIFLFCCFVCLKLHWLTL